MLPTTLLMLLAAALPTTADTTPVTTVVRVDSSKKEIVVTAGPFHIVAMPPGMAHELMEMMDGHDTPVYRFEWPTDGWFRGFGLELLDAAGKPLPRRILHHLIIVHYDRRQLLYSAVERLMGAGQETADASVPKSIGVPMTPGSHLGFYVAWSNETGKDIEGAQLRMRLEYSPKNLNPRPVNALPIYMDVNLTVGAGNTFDVPPGISTKSWEFSPPVSGRLLAVGGHLHDYGVSVHLEDVETGKVMADLEAEHTPDGKVTNMPRKLFGVTGAGLRLKAGKRYRVVGQYNNPTGELIKRGAMAHMVGLFAPDDVAKWPKLDLSDPTLQDDLADLDNMGHASGHDHGAHKHQ